MSKQESASQQEQRREELLELGSETIRLPNGNIHCLAIVGQIEGHQVLPDTVKTTKYEHVIPELAAMEESREIDGVLLLLNTVGGDIEAGLAISELIAGMKTPVVSLVLGGGHSIGVPLAVSARRSLIAPSAGMTIHPVRTTGMVVGVPQSFAYLERIQDRIIDFVVAHSHITRETFRALMLETGELAQDVGSVLYGGEAVSCGLIDQLGGLSDALGWLHQTIDSRAKKSRKPEKK